MQPILFFFSSRRRHTRSYGDWSSDVCSSDLVRDPLRHAAGRDPAGLGVADLAGYAAAEFEADLRQLRGLAGPGLASDDHYLVIPDDLGDLVLQLADRKLRWIRDHGHGAPACLHPGLGHRQFRANLAERLLARVGVAQR